ncbi:FAD-dependent oxidoreductase [bacterium]|nr:FAD-dependent oxidoreductase [bacterium]
MRLLLVGSGHSHLFVLEALARQRVVGLDLTLVAPSPLATYSGMVPGVLNRQYPLRAAQIDVRRLAARAGGRFVAGRAAALDADARAVALADGVRHDYDVVSFDIGSQVAPIAADAGAPLVAIKPMDAALAALEAALAARPSAHAVVIGGGAAGCELALALAARLRPGGGRVTVCDPAPRPLPGLGARAAAAIQAAFAAAGIRWVGGQAATRVSPTAAHLADGSALEADLVVAAAGAVGDGLFAAAGLAVDERRFLRVDATLRCPARPEVFAAGDCATPPTPTPKSGVYAVRQGPLLAANLRAALAGGTPRPFRPQRHALALLNTADGRALLSYAGLAARGRWAWRLKDWIDRRFVARFDDRARLPLG